MALDSRIHHEVMRSFLELGHAPNVDQIATRLQASREEVTAGLRRLHDGHGLVLHPGSCEIWVAHPFASSPTGVWVESGTRGWWAPCVWCALGIVTLAAADAEVHVRLGGESRAAEIAIRDGEIMSRELVVHFALPVARAWDNVIHWCATVQPFSRSAEIAAWCARHALSLGAVVPLPQVFALARAWYGPYLDPTWQKWTVQEARAIFAQVGLSGDSWQLPAVEGRF